MRAHNGSDAVAVRRARFFPGASAPHRDKNISTFQNAVGVTESAADGCLATTNASRALWKKGESSAPSVFHAFLGAICERPLRQAFSVRAFRVHGLRKSTL